MDLCVYLCYIGTTKFFYGVLLAASKLLYPVLEASIAGPSERTTYYVNHKWPFLTLFDGLSTIPQISAAFLS